LAELKEDGGAKHWTDAVAVSNFGGINAKE
jgi:hypothetical protein